MTPRDERLNARNLSTLFSKGWTAARAARHYGVQERTVRIAAERHGLTRFDAPGILLAEIAAAHGVTCETVSDLADKRGMKSRLWRGSLMVSKDDAAALNAHYAQQLAPEDYAHYLSTAQAAALLGITPSGLRYALHLGSEWAADVIRVKVRTRSRWAYAYCPRSVEAAKAKREA